MLPDQQCKRSQPKRHSRQWLTGLSVVIHQDALAYCPNGDLTGLDKALGVIKRHVFIIARVDDDALGISIISAPVLYRM